MTAMPFNKYSHINKKKRETHTMMTLIFPGRSINHPNGQCSPGYECCEKIKENKKNYI